jgi:hypothetical protein
MGVPVPLWFALVLRGVGGAVGEEDVGGGAVVGTAVGELAAVQPVADRVNVPCDVEKPLRITWIDKEKEVHGQQVGVTCTCSHSPTVHVQHSGMGEEARQCEGRRGEGKGRRRKGKRR